jgi:large subunit ribosomal protein L22
MSKIDYSVKVEPENTSKAIGRELHISPKKSMEICREVKGMKASRAKSFLEGVIALKRAVPFRRFKRDVPHRKGEGIMSGRYPKNAALGILQTIEHAEHNAEYKGLDPEVMFIKHAAAHRGQITQGRMPRAMGRATAKNKHTTNIEIILKESEE